MRPVFLLITLLAAPAFAQPELPLPQLFTVIGVAADDTLNVRQGPSASTPDVGDLTPNQTVEILMLSDDGKWGMVSTGENIGWVATRLLTRTPGTTGDGISLPYGLPVHMSCSGAEPFWAAEIVSGHSIMITDFSYDNPTPHSYPMLGMTKPVNTGPYVYGFVSQPLSGVIRRETCDDGMSDTQYGWSIEILKAKQDGVSMISGCCQATLN